MDNEEFARAGESATDRNALSIQGAHATSNTSTELHSDRLANAMFLLRGWVWETDLDGRFTYISDSVLHFSARPPQWHYGKTREELGNNVVDPEYIQLINSKMKAREPFGPIEYQRIQDGKPFWLSTCGMPVFDESGTLVAYRGVAYDISSEVLQRERLSNCQAQVDQTMEILGATIDCFPEAVSVFDAELKLVVAKSKYYALLDIPMAQFPVGSSYSSILQFLGNRGELRGGEVNEIIDKHMAIVQSGEISTFQRTRPNGLCIEAVSVPLPGGGFVHTHTDVTAVSEMRWKLQAMQREARQLQMRLETAQQEINRLQTALRDSTQ